jgi:hypothetical protein
MDTGLGKCKLCGSPVRVVRREDGKADHYEGVDPEILPAPPIPAPLGDFLDASRRGKKTVAIVGAAWSSRAWAPYEDLAVEIWTLNEMHGRSGLGRITRWFDVHPKKIFMQNTRHGHRDWMEEKHPFPIYTQRIYDNVPSSVPYPLAEIQKTLLTRIWRNDRQIKKIFSSTVAYMVALALYEGFERIELFGIELVMTDEWAYQREALSFWLGKADGMGIEVWMPEACSLFRIPLYGYEEMRNATGGTTPMEMEVP